MILTCPECKSRYVVNPSALLPRGRTVRCAKCSHSWFEKKPEDDVEIVPPPPKPEPAPVEKTEEPEAESPSKDEVAAEQADQDDSQTSESEVTDFPINKPRKRRRPVPKGSNLPALQNQKYGSSKMGWVSLVIFVTAIISSFLIFQETIIRSWPATNKLYTAIGLNEPVAQTIPQEEPKAPIGDLLKVDGLAPRLEQVNNIPHLFIAGYIENVSNEMQSITSLIATLKDASGQDLRSWDFTADASVISAGERVTFETSLPNPPAEARDISVSILDNR